MLLFLALVWASLAVELIWQFSLESVLNDIMTLIDLQEALDFLHQSVEKLISITLHHRIDGDSLISYEGIAKFLDR